MTRHVTLTPLEQAQAQLVAEARATASKDKPNRHGLKVKSWDQELNAAAAELAVAKLTGRYWCGGVNTFKDEDVYGGLQVRHSTYDNGNLIVRDPDNSDHYFVLVTGHIPNFSVHGYLPGWKAKEYVYWGTKNDRDCAWWVPQNDVFDIGDLVAEVGIGP
jgi:hypothetical protein